MPAFRAKNLRSGDLAEQLGLLLLQNVALVAPVPRTEDVGIDAVVTLLEDFDKHRFKASNSFYVQIKAKSVRSIEYLDEQVNWLFELELPFFVAEIDKSKTRIELYCAHKLHEAYVIDPKRSKLCVEFKDGIDVMDLPDGHVINIGPPVMSWSMNDIDGNPELRSQFNKICRAHIEAYKKSTELRRVGHAESVVWNENNEPEIKGWKSILPDLEDGVTKLSDITIPYFVQFIDMCVKHENDEWLQEVLLLTQGRRLMLKMRQATQQCPGAEFEVPEEFRFVVERYRQMSG